MHIAEVVTIAKSLPLLRLNTYKSLILSYSADYRRIFGEKQLEKFLQTRVEGHGRSGCGGGGDPDLRETGTGMWSCLSALFEEILCTVSDYNPVEYLLF